MSDDPSHLSLKIASIVVALLLAAFLLEALARLVFAYKDQLAALPIVSSLAPGELVLDPYEMESPKHGRHWVLRPGYPFDKESPVTLRINSYGMRGAEIDREKTRLRILALGDSVTFGIRAVSYPQIVETTLADFGHSVEVVNAGVEGYGTRNLAYEMDRYVELRPDVVTIFIGWNGLFSSLLWEAEFDTYYRTVWLLRNVQRFAHRLFAGEKIYAQDMLQRSLNPVKGSPDVTHAANYIPPFLDEIVEIIKRFKTEGARVYLISLPGLFVDGKALSRAALAKGHLPPFTDNPYVLAKMTARYNASLRELAQIYQTGLIDLAQWGKSNLVPRDEYFTDSVHLTGEGLRKIGHRIAKEIMSDL